MNLTWCATPPDAFLAGREPRLEKEDLWGIRDTREIRPLTRDPRDNDAAGELWLRPPLSLRTRSLGTKPPGAVDLKRSPPTACADHPENLGTWTARLLTNRSDRSVETVYNWNCIGEPMLLRILALGFAKPGREAHRTRRGIT